MKKMFYILRQKMRKSQRFGQGEGIWQTVSLYDNENHFRGQACFDNKRDAQEYMKIYNSMLTNRNEQQNQSNNHVSKINIELKIFK